MKERYDQKSGDVYLWISQEEVNTANNLGPGALIARLVNEEKCIFFTVTRSILENDYLRIYANSNEDCGKVWTTFQIEVGDMAWQEIEQVGYARDRYSLIHGSHKITILLGSPEVEGLDALPR